MSATRGRRSSPSEDGEESCERLADLALVHLRAKIPQLHAALEGQVREKASNVRNMNQEKAEGLSPELQAALEPSLAAVESVSPRTAEYNTIGTPLGIAEEVKSATSKWTFIREPAQLIIVDFTDS